MMLRKKRTMTSSSTLGLFLFILIHSILLCLAENWDLKCPTKCDCKWYKNRKVADCSKAGFSTIPSRLSGEVQVLRLPENSIRSLNKFAFKAVNLINLQQLVLSKNRIKGVDKDAFVNLIILLDLDLSYNQISVLHPQTFTGLVKMRKLILDHNLLSRLEAYQFPVLGNLHHLHINDCKLNYINIYAFQNLANVNSLGLRGNQLTILDPNAFTSRTRLRSVQLSNNIWVCDCKLRKLIRWVMEKKLVESQVSCHTPKRVAGKRWLDLEGQSDLACAPKVKIPRKEVQIQLGGNATLACGASAEPPPSIEWILDSRVLLNGTELMFSETDSEPHVRFLINENKVGEVFWTNLTVLQNGEDFMLHDFEQTSPFRCKVENPAELVERNVTLVLAEINMSPIKTSSNLDMYIIVAVSIVGILVLILIILISVCIVRKRPRRDAPIVKVNGTQKQTFMERNNIVIVNPVEKPPRNSEFYEQLPTAEIELTDLTQGTHKNFEEMNYPEERSGRVRSPLTPLEEEEFDQTSMNTTTTVDYSLHYPDLLDNVKLPPRAISPTQLSYHSLMNPMYSPEWRYSYAYPNEPRLSTSLHSRFSVSPQPFQQRPGYVTLPRRPKAASISGVEPPLKSTVYDALGRSIEPPLKNTIYDTLGPRTTADGTSKTDLTRPMSRSVIETSSLSPLREHLQLSSMPRLIDKGRHILPLSTPEEETECLVTNGLPSVNYRTDSDNYHSPTAKTTAIPVLTENLGLNGLSSSLLHRRSLTSPGLVGLQSEQSNKKKLPPKPPPKPVNKRLSVASSTSDSLSRKSSVDSTAPNFSEEGPDGTEV